MCGFTGESSGPKPNYSSDVLSYRAKQYMPAIKKASRRYNVDEKLITALIQVESVLTRTRLVALTPSV
ncbi:hypothetical protein PCI56_27935 [Plesiomonas shigelloides subsp. oncorhynchi]|nr:hypothetical protein [Plesiomonas shigelloides]